MLAKDRMSQSSNPGIEGTREEGKDPRLGQPEGDNVSGPPYWVPDKIAARGKKISLWPGPIPAHCPVGPSGLLRGWVQSEELAEWWDEERPVR